MLRYVASLTLLSTVLGCTNPQAVESVPGFSSDEVAQLRSKLLVTAEPPTHQTVIEVRNALAEANENQTADRVSVIGQIGGMPNPYGDDVQPAFPWVDGQAVFFLADPTTAAEFVGHQHAEGEECSFCMGRARDLVDTVAMVQLAADGDRLIPARADQLLGLSEGQTVIVTGTAHMDLGMLVIEATGVHVHGDDLPTAEDRPNEVVE